MSLTTQPPRISNEERLQRINVLRRNLSEKNIGALLLGSTESLLYFTGLVWHSSERLLGAVITQTEIVYIVPGFEQSRVESLPHLPGEIRTWQEEENSAALVASLLNTGETLGVDDAVPLFVYNALRREIGADRLVDAGPIIREQRIAKSQAEINIIKYAMGLTLEVHRRAHQFIRPGIAASDVVRFMMSSIVNLAQVADPPFALSLLVRRRRCLTARMASSFIRTATSFSSTPVVGSMAIIPI